MRIDPATFLANLYLYSYETDFISSLIKTDKPGTLKFKNASRFIDYEFNQVYCNLKVFSCNLS